MWHMTYKRDIHVCNILFSSHLPMLFLFFVETRQIPLFLSANPFSPPLISGEQLKTALSQAERKQKGEKNIKMAAEDDSSTVSGSLDLSALSFVNPLLSFFFSSEYQFPPMGKSEKRETAPDLHVAPVSITSPGGSAWCEVTPVNLSLSLYVVLCTI